MKKRTKFIFIPLFLTILIIGILYFLYYFTPRDINTINLPELNDKEFNLSKKDYIEDFDYTYDTLKQYYPYFKTNKELYGVDWLANKEVYKNYISLSESDEDFFYRLNDILLDLNNGHTHLVDRNFGMYSYLTYYAMPRFNWRNDIAKIYEKDKVRRRYNITNQSLREYMNNQDNEYLNNQYQDNEYPNFGFLPIFNSQNRVFAANKSFIEPENIDFENLITENLIDQKLAYIKINKMLNIDQLGSDEILLDEFLQQIQDYPNLVIDIRGNGGGDSRYWQEFLLPKIIGRSYKTTNYSFLKKGELNKKVVIQEGYHANINNFLKTAPFSKQIKKFLKDFDYYNNEDLIVDPKKDSINFQGNIYLLVNQDVYSSAEMLASFCKETGLAKLVGSKTAGDGIGSDPMQIDLPNTGYVLRFSKNMGLTGSGSINELDQTTPDIKSETGQFEENLIDEKAIQAVIEDAGLN